MNTELLKKILMDETDAAATLVTTSNGEAHIANTWNSYIVMKDEKTLLVPVGGMTITEKNLESNTMMKLSVSSRSVQGFHYPGTGLVIEAHAKVIKEGVDVEEMKTVHPWIRGILQIEMYDIQQTQ